MVKQSGGSNAIDVEAVLNVAEQLCISVGPTSVTMVELARRSGVARATLYRYWPNVDTLIRAVAGRAFERAIAAALASTPPPVCTHGAGLDEPDELGSLVAVLVALMQSIRTNELFRSIVSLDERFLVPYLLQRRSVAIDDCAAWVVPMLERGIRQGFVRGDVDDRSELAITLMLTTMAFVLTVPLYEPDASVVAELYGDAVRRLLSPSSQMSKPTSHADASQSSGATSPADPAHGFQAPTSVGHYNAIADDVIFDAAHRLVLEVGPAALTMSDVARASGASRATLYRRFRSAHSLINGLFDREFLSIGVATVNKVIESGPAIPLRTRLAAAVVEASIASRSNALLRVMIERDPLWLMSFLITVESPSLHLLISFVESAMSVAIDDGTLRYDQRRSVALTIVAITLFFVVTGPVLVPHEVLDRRLEDLVDRVLAP